MEQNEGFIDSVVNSFKYGLSNPASLLVGGLLFILSLAIIGIPFVLGYVTRCMRELLKGNKKMPDFDDVGELLKDGIFVTILFVIYGIVIFLIYLVALIPIILSDMADSNVLLIIGLVLLVPIMIIIILLGIMAYLVWVVYAATDDLGKAVNPLNSLKLILANPVGFLLLMVGIFIIGLISAFACIFIVTIPWVGFFQYVAYAYILTWFYKETMNTGKVTLA
ncbi:hypothetical protein CUJ83_03785 [Methanocella sp. CWC-04]|uniref:DUF4013 domain-containing protein n=1 Tax=Methanooceanicella nereidis TaxID=2052831 RepID=A0AAP2RDN2_9EURY|nr:DUF4013 domain-containing protein [Methanocella sp. CWC-04]MCD1294115.1 hypothetical protein [Methanocella sp. CWC-04]